MRYVAAVAVGVSIYFVGAAIGAPLWAICVVAGAAGLLIGGAE